MATHYKKSYRTITVESYVTERREWPESLQRSVARDFNYRAHRVIDGQTYWEYAREEEAAKKWAGMAHDTAAGDPLTWAMKADTIAQARAAIESGLENTRELLSQLSGYHEDSKKSLRLLQECFAKEINEMQEILEKLKAPDGSFTEITEPS